MKPFHEGRSATGLVAQNREVKKRWDLIIGKKVEITFDMINNSIRFTTILV